MRAQEQKLTGKKKKNVYMVEQIINSGTEKS